MKFIILSVFSAFYGENLTHTTIVQDLKFPFCLIALNLAGAKLGMIRVRNMGGYYAKFA
jgi:hypothetical protein